MSKISKNTSVDHLFKQSLFLRNPLILVRSILANMNINSMSALKQYILAWVGLPFIAILNGLLRELTYCYVAGEKTGHQISSIFLSIIICFYVIILNSRVTLKNSSEAFSAGFVWLILTVAFEIIIGFVAGTPLDQQIQSYNILDGNLWIVVLLTVFLAPVLLRRRSLSNIFG